MSRNAVILRIALMTAVVINGTAAALGLRSACVNIAMAFALLVAVWCV